MRKWTKCRNCGEPLGFNFYQSSGYCSKECAIEAYGFNDSEMCEEDDE